MCGILGRVNKNEIINRQVFTKQLDTLTKRGPDTSGSCFWGNVALGHRRLSIIDLSEKGNQPMLNETGDLAVVFNGEIYNYKEILANLQSTHVISSSSDTEVLLHGYEDLGRYLVKKIEGMFAFCIYDRSEEQLFLARDHFGKKPLYYYLDDSVFIFASEIKAILADPYFREKLNIDSKSLIKFLHYGYIPSPHTMYAQIHKLEPSHSIVFDIRSWRLIEKESFWEPQHIITQHLSEEEVMSTLDSLVDSAVVKRLISDVPLGIFLSGGVDSSLIAHYVSQHTKDLSSYTVCYDGSKEIDESEFARFVAESKGFKHNLVNFGSGDVQPLFSEIYKYLDEPFADAAIIPLYFISKVSRKDFTVVLSGDGGDELFAGYPKYLAQNLIEKNKWAGGAASYFAKLPLSINYSRLFKMYSYDFPIRHLVFGSGGFLPKEVDALLGENVELPSLDEIFEDALGYNAEYQRKDPVNRGSYLDCRLQLPDGYLVKSDRATMANSQEVRSPLLDKALADFAFSLDGASKIKYGNTKYLLKKLAERYFPPSFVNRRKQGFGVPLNKWIRTELKDSFYEVCLEDTHFFNVVEIEKLINSHMSGEVDNSFKLLRIFSINNLLGGKNGW